MCNFCLYLCFPFFGVCLEFLTPVCTPSLGQIEHGVEPSSVVGSCDTALNKFRTDHGIPMDVEIKLSWPNEDANLVEGHIDHGAPLQCRGPVAYLYRSAAEEGARHSLLEGSGSSGAELNVKLPQAKVWEEGVTSSSSSYAFSESLDTEEEGEEAISRLAVNKRRNGAPPLAKPKVPAIPISSSSSNNEHSNDLAFTPLQLAGEVEIAHSLREGYDTDVSSSEINMGRFRTLGQKKFAPAAGPPAIAVPPISQVSLSALDPIPALSTRAGVKPSSSKSPPKRKGKELAACPSKKSENKTGETVADSAKNHDTSLALARAVMLSKDVANLVKEGSEEIRDLIVMQQVQSLQRASATLKRMEQSAEIKKSKKKIISLEKQARLDSQAAEKARMELVAAVQERDASNAAISEARGEVAAIQVKLNKALEQLVELEKVASGPVYERVYNRGIDRAGYNYNKQLANLHPGILQDEMLEEEADEIPKKSPEVVGELDQETAKDGIAVAEDGAAAVEDGVASEWASPNLSPDL
ncbi:hypothetical protein Acr_13g0007620 [Actinidia rufa]|uniref:Uncharacterized protein n=1 Tax=Actinidia rufa TaxID=165716 RepID=A0A7J0FKY0_9ERIC|nr:hypothetical protein Acr_13g0007620 [Actinidia rufa]